MLRNTLAVLALIAVTIMSPSNAMFQKACKPFCQAALKVKLTPMAKMTCLGQRRLFSQCTLFEGQANLPMIMPKAEKSIVKVETAPLPVVYECCPKGQTNDIIDDTDHCEGGSNNDPFQHDDILRMRYYSVVAYHKDKDSGKLIDWQGSSKMTPLKAFTPKFDITDESTNLRVYGGYDAKLAAVVVAIRGTQILSGKNWALNLNAGMVEPVIFPGAGKLSVHKGFYSGLVNLRRAVTTPLGELLAEHSSSRTKQVTVWVTGHSLGGASGAFLALDLSVNGVDYGTLRDGRPIANDLRLVTFGSPKIGNEAFNDYLVHHVPNTISVVNDGWLMKDIVTKLPPSFACWDYCGVPKELLVPSTWCKPIGSHGDYWGVKSDRRSPALSNRQWKDLEEEVLETL